MELPLGAPSRTGWWQSPYGDGQGTVTPWQEMPSPGRGPGDCTWVRPNSAYRGVWGQEAGQSEAWGAVYWELAGLRGVSG